MKKVIDTQSKTWYSEERFGAEPAQNQAAGVVYFIQEGSYAGPIKIGWSSSYGSALGRLNALQTGNSSELHLRGHIVGSKTRERELHKRFAEYRLRGEWFKPAPEVFAYLNCERADEPSHPELARNVRVAERLAWDGAMRPRPGKWRTEDEPGEVVVRHADPKTLRPLPFR